MLNAVVPGLPSFVCYFGCTCNCFTAEDVDERWKFIEQAYQEAGLDKLLGPLLGFATDGDRRRRKLELIHCLDRAVASGDPARFKPVDHESFGFSFEINPETGLPRWIGDQDWLQ
jgi:hypothetical protein